MTDEDTRVRNAPNAVRVRATGDVDDRALAYLREKIAAALHRPGLPAVSGEVRLERAAAHHVELPWSCGAEIRVGADLMVVHAREASAREVADRSEDRLRSRVERTLHRTDAARRSAPPPRRGGRPIGQPSQGSAARVADSDEATG
ncbi:hypothetical protein [Streptomyces sp. NL15-2K]|uniref:hypothetical protein n=1 Tax=Streptomyces sp. NL15-2K TaxID=376149 RepID=UPI000F56A1E6|nr:MULTISPECIES: hypothetical protein [Actinomycetes]WKX06892.1 hypothetical protein Q4V64_05045 [Kutzneria buriramensis]GCB44068.1 hypothetical protein SNL152K_1353 [Streptomyces sp. NL15-2K]